MYKYILWDNDGVLVDTEVRYFRATQRVFRELSLDLDAATFHEYMIRGRRCWSLASEAGVSDSAIQSSMQRRDAYYRELIDSEDIDIPGVDRTLQTLSSRHAMAIVTTANRDYFDWIHAGRELVNHMQFVLTLEDYPRAKPEPDPYLAAMRRFEAGPREAVAVEDTERGLRSAVAAGIDCIIVRNDFNRGHDFSSAHRVLDSITELPAVLNA